MKKYFFFMLLAFSILSTGIIAQHRMGDRKRNFRDRIDQLEKIKLIEELHMSEEVTMKFFAKRNEFREKGKRLNEKIDSLSALIREKSSNKDEQTSATEWKKIIDEFISTEKTLQRNKLDFFNSLQNLLTPQQMAEFLAFEKRFREEMQEIILHGRNKPIPE
ncbi:MAG: hypothetical protein Q8N83_13640 [Ignavibacteria bacterium]|nr:hypothetical protein [Ignavibacteria bacterium]